MFQYNFNGGIIAPTMNGRVDQTKYQSGLQDCHNMVCLPHGAVEYRNGFEYIYHKLGNNTKQRLIPFVFSNEQALIVVFSPPYIYFSTQGKMLLDADNNLYKIDCPYSSDELIGIRYAQSADIITITHRNHTPKLLKRLGAASWSISDVTTGYNIATPTNVKASPSFTNTTNANRTTYYYVVVAVNGKVLSKRSEVVSAENDLTLKPNYNTISWDAVSGAERYKVYKLQGGLYGYIGETDDLSITDNYIEPDTVQTPPYLRNPFASGNPTAVSYVQQRKIYGGGTNTPQLLNLSRASTEDDYTYSVPALDDDAIQIRIAAKDGNGIQHIVPMNDIMIFTQGSVWKMPNTQAITSENIGVYIQTYTGSNDCTPLLTDNTCIFSSDQTGHIHELGMSANKNGAYNTTDISLLCPHLFEGYDIIDQALIRNPFTCAFFVREDGVMIGLTYDPVQQIYAFHEHQTDGLIESVAVIPEDQQTCLYLSVKRGDDRYIERLRLRKATEQSLENHLDCSAVITSTEEKTVFSGLDWLNGKSVKVVTDGALYRKTSQVLVTDGQIELTYPAKTIIIGLPYDGYMTTLPMYDANNQRFSPTKPKKVTNIFARVYKSSAFYVSQGYEMIESSLAEKTYVGFETQAKTRSDEDFNSPPRLQTGILEVPIFNTLEKDIQVRIEQQDPLPLQVQAIGIEYA